ncbi:cadherin 26 [Willisornis vidua]|uniref:Cadherin 26 n=1 Tax=Willisornis vidua TaxID=1566151 RepID=A0ABQ9CRM4_9PASS|nr:cadherin 26 [Willisornis vidua]
MIVQDDHAGHKVTEVTAAMLEARDVVSFFYQLISHDTQDGNQPNVSKKGRHQQDSNTQSKSEKEQMERNHGEHVAGACPGPSKWQEASVGEMFLDFESVQIIKEDAEDDSASDLSDSERIPIPPSPCTPPELILRAEEIDPDCLEHVPEMGFKEPDYYYPDFLPPPFNSWDLKQLAILVHVEGKADFRPRPTGSLEKYLARLVQLEWLQLQTEQSERAKARPHTAPGASRALKSPGKGKALLSPLPSRQVLPQDGAAKLPRSCLGLRGDPHWDGRQVAAAKSFTQESKNASFGWAIRGKSLEGVDSYHLGSLSPLRRAKRTWVITTIDVQEEDKGPFPKYAGQLHHIKALDTSLKYLISGPGVDEPPEVGLFSIEDDVNGHVYVHRTIDREKTPDFLVRFDIEHRDSGEPLGRPLFFNIKVQDINDNAPEFAKEEYSITVRENHSQDEPVFQITALDKDEADTMNSQVSYSISMQMPIPDGFTFKIDPTNGSIFLTRCLDYQTANSFKLLIKASDQGSPQLSSTATVNVAVEDANNHLPVFASADPLDYEGDSEMRLVISVANEEPFFLCKNGIVMTSSLESTNTTVNIKVIQSQRALNFHPPVLTVQKEDSMKPGRVFRKYPATYPDDVPNNIKYELAHDPGRWLSVDENSGVLTVAKEFEKESPFVNNSLYTIIVRATAPGFPPQTATGTILLYLSDMNDHMPSLVVPSLDVCDKKEGTILLIHTKPALVHSHSGPFTFELAEDSEDVKHNWTLGRNFGQSVELLMVRSLPQGSYFVPIIIQDKEGFSTRQRQHIRLCFCPDGHTCTDSPVPQAAVGLGGGAIAIMVMAFLLLLVSIILLCQCHGSGSKSKAIVLPWEGEQTSIRYNEESRSPFLEAKLDITQHTAPTSVSVETGKEGSVEKLYYQTTLEDSRDVDEPCRYFEEGELKQSGSLCSVSTGSEDLPVDFLNNLGPSFSALEEICQKRSPSVI